MGERESMVIDGESERTCLKSHEHLCGLRRGSAHV